MRGDKTFAYDLVMGHGAVSSRVVLLLRSAEAKPPTLSFVEKHPSRVLVQGVEGGLARVQLRLDFGLKGPKTRVSNMCRCGTW